MIIQKKKTLKVNFKQVNDMVYELYFNKTFVNIPFYSSKDFCKYRSIIIFKVSWDFYPQIEL